MKKLAFLLLILLLIPFVTACQSQHAVIFEEEATWLYEEIDTVYTSGDTVRLRIGKVDGLAYLFLVNGKEYECEFENEEFWQFSFRMPNKEAVIEFKTYDAAITDPDEVALIEAYLLASRYQDGIAIEKFYGKHPSGAIAAIMTAGNYDSSYWDETVAGKTFYYPNSNRILVLYKGEFVTLPEAYEKKALTDTDIAAICEAHRAAYPDLYPAS